MKLIKSYLIGIATFVVTILLFLFIVSLVFTYTKIEDRFIDSGIFLSMAISAFISSFVLCKMIKKKGIVHGIIVNAMELKIAIRHYVLHVLFSLNGRQQHVQNDMLEVHQPLL